MWGYKLDKKGVKSQGCISILYLVPWFYGFIVTGIACSLDLRRNVIVIRSAEISIPANTVHLLTVPLSN
jgi:hypothetical protein